MEISDELPYNDYFEYFGPQYRLHIDPSQAPNDNSDEYLWKIQEGVLEHLRNLPSVPSVQMQPIPQDAFNQEELERMAEDNADPEKRLPSTVTDKIVEDAGEFYDGENAGEDRRNEQSYKRAADDEKTQNGTSTSHAGGDVDMDADRDQSKKPRLD
ncbi:hypothetical protein L596_016435 [Steinernema carpocapsae]|uniref:Uncharacterized protein n=1 Tax=Steinernema carpocapsae TaxID=34508 RepID=A0A4V6A3E5_STECR|nr:hypothetical protein L596_016435 [Steinernema carpocapsae]